jgi:hypothetical protein
MCNIALIIALIAIAAVVVSLLVLTRPAGAGIEYPWCAQYSGGSSGGGRNCGFSTIEQSRATISGMGGFCEPNLFYPGSASATSKSKSKREHAR